MDDADLMLRHVAETKIEDAQEVGQGDDCARRCFLPGAVILA
jgi:hypothetical protein